MTDLTPITALGADKPAKQQFGPLRISENPAAALASLALRRGASRPMPMGLELPGPGKWAAGHGVAAFWTGPDQWMIEAENRAIEDFAADLTAHAAGCSITEQTDGWTVFEIVSESGDAPIRAMMEKLVNLDVAAFGPGSATRTGLHHMSVFLIRRSGDRLAIMTMRSTASELWHVLEETAKGLG
ncbi:sarcosine oxidase subunit gamma [Paracoccus methylarcula]|uniref:Sarcosine oxidase subunit gamma n=1 Tax=Paracoccus methylarcula TaxID=72022 RepID=A0A3R7NCZ2_9RHOB|nr:sarcosine oxidase subunit gamma [Paracoccus methylarcula]RNF35262.1 sarcosine oxidase subunit gamma [Paracoccus methylarcula]